MRMSKLPRNSIFFFFLGALVPAEPDDRTNYTGILLIRNGDHRVVPLLRKRSPLLSSCFPFSSDFTGMCSSHTKSDCFNTFLVFVCESSPLVCSEVLRNLLTATHYLSFFSK